MSTTGKDIDRPRRRRAIICSTMAMVMAAGLLVSVATSPAAAQTVPPRTPTPSNVSVTVGDVEATVSWDAAGNSEPCYTSRWMVRIKKVSDWSDVAISSMLARGTTSWYVGELEASTDYRAEVFGWTSNGGGCSDPKKTGGGYSLAAKAKFTTNASTASGDPAASGTLIRVPRRVSNLAVTKSGTSATVTWAVPAARGNNRRCSATGTYSWKLKNMTTGVVTYLMDDSGGHASQTSRTATLTGLTVGNKYKIRVYVAGSVDSDNCGWSRARAKTWTQ